MLNNQPRAYYITDKFLNLWIFQHTSNNEILYEIYNNQHKKIHSAILATNCMEDFLLDIGEQNDIHLMVRKNSGELLYYFFNGQKWSILKLFHLKNDKNSFQLLSLHIYKGKTHILYTIQNVTKKWLFIDLFWENNHWNHVNFFQSTIKPTRETYTSMQDDKGNIYFICKWWDGVEEQLQFCQLHEKVNLWDQSVLPLKKGNSPSIWITKDKIYVCCISSAEGKYRILYLNKNTSSSNGTQWKKFKEIYSSSNKIHCPFFGLIQNKLTLFWIEEQKLYCKQSNNLGETWDICKIFNYVNQPKFYRYLPKKQNINNKSFYILSDLEHTWTYPISFFPKQKEVQNIDSEKIKNNIDKNGNIFSIDLIHTLDEKAIENLDIEYAKAYIKVLKKIVINLYKEISNLKKQNTKNTIQPPSTHNRQKNSSIFPSILKNSNDTMQIKKECLKAKIIENENIKLKSDILEYNTLMSELQKDIKNLQQEINDMKHKNRILQNEIEKIENNTLGHKISKFFMGGK